MLHQKISTSAGIGFIADHGIINSIASLFSHTVGLGRAKTYCSVFLTEHRIGYFDLNVLPIFTSKNSSLLVNWQCLVVCIIPTVWFRDVNLHLPFRAGYIYLSSMKIIVSKV
jgi:hypothetical protein